MLKIGFDIVYLCAKFDDLVSSHFIIRGMVGAHQNLSGSRDLTTHLSGMICRPWATTYYNQHVYQI